jgi:hypothetical protein
MFGFWAGLRRRARGMMEPVPRTIAILLAVLAGAGQPPLHPSAPAAKPAPGRNTGTVVGTLRHKGCQSSAGGATVTVVGRDVSTTSDESGRFSLALPPGTYSLVIHGPNLVADQRIDEVAVSLGASRDLGIVQVWPEERPPNCGSFPAPPAEELVLAIAPDTPSLDLPGATVAAATAAPEQVLLRGLPGSGPGQFGMQGSPARDDQDALGPSSFAVGPQGSIYVLDALNGRVQRFDHRGKLLGTFPVPRRQGTEPAVESDIAVSEEGHVFLFTSSDCLTLAECDLSGKVLVSGVLPPSFKGVDLMFATRRPIFLMQNGQAVRAELGWGGLRAEGPFPGLPVGELFVHAERVSRWLAAVKLLTADGRVRRSVQLHSRVPVTGVRLVGLNRRGEMVIAVDRAEGADEAPPAAEVLLLAVTPLGRLAGAASVPPGDRRFEFREFSIAPDGAVIQMQSDASEVRLVRWVLPPPPRDAIAGEGLVKGRVVEGGRPLPGAAVSVGRPRRVIPVSADGTFEVRLPAGTYVVSFRHPGMLLGAETAPVERKVAVAAGSTVDLGNVWLAPLAPVHGQGTSTPLEGSKR